MPISPKWDSTPEPTTPKKSGARYVSAAVERSPETPKAHKKSVYELPVLGLSESDFVEEDQENSLAPSAQAFIRGDYVASTNVLKPPPSPGKMNRASRKSEQSLEALRRRTPKWDPPETLVCA